MLFVMSSWTSGPSQLEKSALLGWRSSQLKNINRWGAALILTYRTQVLSWRERERKSLLWKMRNYSCCWDFTLSWSNSILRKFCGIFSLVVSLRKISMFSCVDVLVFLLVTLFLWLWCYDAKCIRYCITIKKLTTSSITRSSPNSCA